MKTVFSSYALVLAALLLGGCTRYVYETVTADPVSEEEVAVDLYLIGDAGRPHRDGEPVLQALQTALMRNPDRSWVVFLGDNLYPDGLQDSLDVEARSVGEWVLNTQVDVLRESGARGIFVPGNHDWQAGGPQGWETLLRQERYLESRGEGFAELLPDNGCPGPEVRDVGEVLRLVLLDSQWWLHKEGYKPLHPDSDCPADSPEEVVAAIQSVLKEATDRVVVVAAHHPIVSGGQHGGYFDWPAYLFPPYPWARRLGWFAPQDVNSAEYLKMRQMLQRAFAAAPPLVYAAGHEHNLQILNGDFARYLVVSGTGIYGHLTSVHVLPQSLYARAVAGFVRLTIRPDRRSRMSVIAVDEQGEMTEEYSFWIEAPSGTPESL